MAEKLGCQTDSLFFEINPGDKHFAKLVRRTNVKPVRHCDLLRSSSIVTNAWNFSRKHSIIGPFIYFIILLGPILQ